MNNAGITTQYGFLFQRKAFILFALENAGTKQTFTFEGRDDIEISADESIYSVKSADASYIQVKSGTISESCFCKVICNWLLFDKESSGTVTLFAENQLDTLVSNITKDIIFDYIIQGKEKKRSSIAWKGLGDLSVVFTKAKELKHQIRIRNIMDFFFNYENIEQIYEKELELELAEKELSEISKDYQEFNRSLFQAKKLFRELHLTYTSDFTKDYATFLKFKNSYTRTAKSKSKDLVYLSKASFSLAEEIKLYTFMKDQSANMVNRKERISRLLSIISSIVNAHPQYTVYTQAITSIIEEIEEEKVILSLTDYTKAVKDIEQEKQKLDSQIELLRSQATELTYEVAMKKVGLLEHIFTILSREINTDRLHELEIKTAQLKKEIKSLKSAFDQSKVKKFNNRLTELYLSSGLNIKHLKEDLQDNDFSLEFDPFRLCLFATHKEQDQLTRFMPGSMTRQTHLQMLTYLCMFEYLKDNFRDFIYLPILIIDSANQPMGIEIFKEVYPTITQLADSIGVQTIFMSKDRLDNIPEDDFIDISAGLNKFHKKS